MDQHRPIVEVRELKTYFPNRSATGSCSNGQLRAVDDVSFEIAEGSTLGLVGESGCGKTTLGRTLLRLIPATGGTVRFDGLDVFDAKASELRSFRRQAQIVFQDTGASLNPRMTVGRCIAEPLLLHRVAKGSELADRVAELLTDVGLRQADAGRYPIELSGGQRQRVGIARALALKPRFVVFDEPVSALDVSVQASVLNLVMDLRRRYGLTCLFIAHDLAVVRHVSDRVAVMFQGQIVEIGPVAELYDSPQHAYTQQLLSAVLTPNWHQRDKLK